LKRQTSRLFVQEHDMSPKYWARIVCSTLAIFVVGLLLVKGFHRGKAFVIDNFPTSIPLMMNAGFRVDGDRLGEIQRMQFLRSKPGEVDSAVLTVKIADAADAQRIESCTLRATNAHPFSSSTRFLCTSHTDSARLDLVPFGHIEILPDGKQITFYIASEIADDMRDNAYRGRGSDDSGDVDIHVGDGRFSMAVNGKQILQVNGDSSGGSLTLRDHNGNTIAQFNGDSAGGSMRINDSHGKKIIDLGTNSKKGSDH
jgi:hypothetical protein